ncbi:MAG: hypothetical protein MI923_30955, partial [Phycisphaerales bacterium]|nr:hypothetical protein [Phycisphaerales bacterium]
RSFLRFFSGNSIHRYRFYHYHKSRFFKKKYCFLLKTFKYTATQEDFQAVAYFQLVNSKNIKSFIEKFKPSNYHLTFESFTLDILLPITPKCKGW